MSLFVSPPTSLAVQTLLSAAVMHYEPRAL
jgi:hypothetical protein